MPLVLRSASVDMEPQHAAEDYDHHQDQRQRDVNRPQSPIDALRVDVRLQRRQHRRAGSAARQVAPGVAARAAARAAYQRRGLIAGQGRHLLAVLLPCGAAHHEHHETEQRCEHHDDRRGLRRVVVGHPDEGADQRGRHDQAACVDVDDRGLLAGACALLRPLPLQVDEQRCDGAEEDDRLRQWHGVVCRQVADEHEHYDIDAPAADASG
mmetsp:Transcript_120690/g.336087  ORF Transcript_120690/g.336087 Transcript_120690/m.336087 type:complete len:210 (+) Transcript_120690:805-1434(+)